MKPPLTQLDYAPPPPWHQRATARRILIGFALLLAAGLMLKIAPIAWRRVRLVYWQSKCLSYTAPADKAISLNVSGGPSSSVPHEWDEFYSLLSPPGARSEGTIFLHERISPKGNRRLLVVDSAATLFPFGDKSESALRFSIMPIVRVIKPGSLFSDPLEIPRDPNFAFGADSVCPGEPDAKDASHFTIRSTAHGVESVLDGWLLDDDRVVIEPRSR